MEEILKLDNAVYRLYLSEEEIQRRIAELGKTITNDFRGKIPVFVGVLNGSFLFFADLLKHIEIDCEVDFIKLSSYGNEMETSGTVVIKKDFSADLEGRHIILVEDIVDSGLSLQFLRRYIARHNPLSINFVTLLKKKGTARVPVEIDYTGFEIEDKFVIGYGLDYAQLKRNLRNIYQVIEEKK
jgi:hypoxanthine phosphoribosyltransferase